MESIKDILDKKNFPTVTNDNKIINNDNNINKYNNVTNDNNAVDKKKYALDKSKFNPSTEETSLAEEIAASLDDLQNYACYLNVVNKIGVGDSMRLHKSTLSDIAEKKDTKYPVRDKAAYFMWKYKHRKF